MKTIKLDRFTSGINNVEPETDLPEGAIREGVNVNITNKGRIRRRKGYSKIYSGSGIHSLHERYFVEGTELKFLEPNNLPTVIASGLTNNDLSYCDVNGVLYFSNIDVNGTVNGPWGVDDIFRPPNISVIPGSFLTGRYQISFANVDSNGQLGGAINPLVIDLADGEGISLTNVYQSGYSTAVYISNSNGTELYRQTTIPNGTLSTTITSLDGRGIALDTLFMKKIVTGHIIRHYKGRVYVADGSTLWYTEAQRYGLYSPASNYFQFPERITVVQETENGLFVVADKTYFLSGTDAKAMTLTIVGPYKGVEGTGMGVDASDFKVDANGKAAYWFSNKGVILGFSNGQVKYISEDRFDLDIIAKKGTTGYCEQNGIRSMITNLFEQNSNGSQFGATDNVIAEVVRNGIVI